MKAYLLWACLILLPFLLCAAELPQSNVQPSFHDIFPGSSMVDVSQGLTDFIGKIPPGALLDYGFQSLDELSKAIPGKPLRLYTISPRKILNFKDSQTIDNLLEKTPQWFFPVLVDNTIRAFLIVEERSDTRFEVVSFGYKPLAQQVAKISALANEDGESSSVLAAVFQANEFFLAYPETKPHTLYSLSDAETDSDLIHTMHRLQPVVDACLKGGF